MREITEHGCIAPVRRITPQPARMPRYRGMTRDGPTPNGEGATMSESETAEGRTGAAPLYVAEIVIDCADHGRVVDFWAAALGYERREVNEQYVALEPPAREPGRPPLLFQRVPEPKRAKNRVHLDFRAPVMADEVARLVGLGARVIAERSLGDFAWTVFADPEGNEFCVAGD
jgi:predicted enzyme related to lactoylglutathione lyase